MKILHLPAWYPYEGDELFGLFVRRHILSLPEEVQQAVIFAYPYENISSKVEIRKVESDRITEYFAYYRQPKHNIPVLSSLVKASRFLYAHHIAYNQYKKEHGKHDLTHVHVLTRAGLIASIIKLRFKIPFVVTEHWTRYHAYTGNFKGALRKWLTRKVAKRASAIMPVTWNLADAMQSQGLKNDNYQVIPNVVDADIFVPGNIDEGKIKVVHVSTFGDRQKNLRGMLRVVKAVSEKRNDFYLKIIGTGVDFDEIKSYADEIDVSDFVEFAGPKGKQEVADEIQSSGFLFMFSNYENMPVVISEAMCCGVPILSSRVGGIHEEVLEDRGILVNSGDEADMIVQFYKMLDEFKNYNKEEIRDFAVKRFSEEAVGKMLFDLYSNTTNS